MKIVRLGEIAQINPPRSNGNGRLDEVLTTFVPMPAVDDITGRIVSPMLRPYREVKKGYTFFQENDVLFAKITPCMQNGKHAVARNLIDGIGFGSTEFHVIRPGPDVLPEWIHLFIRQRHILEDAERYFTGAVGQQRIPEDFLFDLQLPLPEIPEQRRIVELLTSQLIAIDRARAAAEERLNAAKGLMAAYLREVFSSPELQSHPIKTLGDICHIRLGKMLSPVSMTGTRARPYLRNVNVQWGRFDLSDVAEMDILEKEEGKLALKPGDLLVCEGGEPGRAAVWQGEIMPCYYQKALHRLRPIEGNVDPYFIMYRLWLGGLAGEFVNTHAKTTIAHLPEVRLRKLHMQVPPIALQQELVKHLESKLKDVGALTTKVESQHADIANLPNLLLREAFEVAQ